MDSKETDSENNDEDEDGDDNNNNDEDVSEEEVDGGEVVDDNETEEKVNDTWTVTGGLETRPLNEHGNYKEFDAKGLEEKFAILADGKVDIQAFFEHGVIVPINPNDVSFNPSAYSGASTTLNAASSDFLNRLLRGNTIYFAPTYNATINSIGEPKSTAHGLNGLIAGMNMEVVSTNTVTENGVKRSSTTLQQKKEQ